MLRPALLVTVLASALGLQAQATSLVEDEVSLYPLQVETELAALEAIGGEMALAEHDGKRGLRVVEAPGTSSGARVLLLDSEMADGTIEIELSGDRRPDAPPEMRGFVGVIFHYEEIAEGEVGYECFYLRPTNGRAEDQLRRNHATQYTASPDWPWYRLREEHPGRYESYVDLVPGAWTKLRIELEGRSARLFVHDAEQPALIVSERLGKTIGGSVALMIGTGTEAFFRDVKITRR